MKRLALLVVPALSWGCHAQVQATVPEPPAVTGGVEANAPAPPVAADATSDVQVDPPQEGEPEEVQATTEPPDPVYEEQTDSPDPSYVWVGGYWGWNGVDWGWNWGRWMAAPSGQFYIEPYYERVGGNVVYVHGYWGPHDAPRRSYGGDTIRFAVAVRPANYHRGEHIVVEHRAGPLPGKRPGGVYVHATGTVRPVPHDSVPHRALAATAAAHANVTARGGVHENVKENVHADVHTGTTQPRDEQKNAPAAHAAPAKAPPAKTPPTKKKP